MDPMGTKQTLAASAPAFVGADSRSLLGVSGATLGLAEVFHCGCTHWLCHAKCGRSHGYWQNLRGNLKHKTHILETKKVGDLKMQ